MEMVNLGRSLELRWELSKLKKKGGKFFCAGLFKRKKNEIRLYL